MPPRSARHAAFGAAIRAIRQKRELSQEELPPAQEWIELLAAVEGGERNVSLTSVFRIADSLGVRPWRSTSGGERDAQAVALWICGPAARIRGLSCRLQG
jgi:transcriptional regulator with XRE-family HTH domain